MAELTAAQAATLAVAPRRGHDSSGKLPGWRFVVASANPDKVVEIETILAAALPDLVLVARPADVPEVAETGSTLLENARLKASALQTPLGCRR